MVAHRFPRRCREITVSATSTVSVCTARGRLSAPVGDARSSPSTGRDAGRTAQDSHGGRRSKAGAGGTARGEEHNEPRAGRAEDYAGCAGHSESDAELKDVKFCIRMWFICCGEVLEAKCGVICDGSFCSFI